MTGAALWNRDPRVASSGEIHCTSGPGEMQGTGSDRAASGMMLLCEKHLLYFFDQVYNLEQLVDLLFVFLMQPSTEIISPG